MDQENKTETKMTEWQLKKLIEDISREIVHVESVKKTAEFRVKRYNELTSRVKFLKKPQNKIERTLRRLYTANRYVDRCIEALNGLNAQHEQYTQQLAAV